MDFKFMLSVYKTFVKYAEMLTFAYTKNGGCSSAG